MHVAVCKLTLHAYSSHSLKEKRRIVASITERLRQRFPVAVAEVGGQDTWQLAVIGIAAVSGEEKHAREIVEKAAEYARSTAAEAEVTDVEFDVVSY